jgi:uncharacterized protein (TIRG00374 family)
MAQARGADWRKFAVRAAVSVAVLAVLFWWLPTEALLGAVARIPPSVWLLVVAGFLAGHMLAALKWRLLLRAAGVAIARRDALRAHGAGLFANLCLPSVVGGDVVRAGIVMRERRQFESVALGSLGDRLNDTLALVLIAVAGGLLVPDVEGVDSGRILIPVALLLFGCVFAGFAIVRWAPLERMPGKLAGVVLRLREAMTALLAAPGTLLMALTLSAAIQSGFILLNIVLANRIGIAAEPALWFFAWPLAKLMALAPVSLGGIGVREVAIAALMAPFGVDAALVVGQSLSWEVVLIVSGLFAGLAAAWLPSGAAAVADLEEEGGRL